MKKNRIGIRTLAVILAMLLTVSIGGISAQAGGGTVVSLSDIVQWGDYGRVQLTDVTEWSAELAELYYTEEKPEGKWVLAIFAIQDGAEFDTDALSLAYEILRLDDREVVRPSANGATQYAATGVIKLTGTMAFFFDVPKDYDPAQAVVTVIQPVHEIEWGDYGRVQLTDVTEWTADLASLYYTEEKPEGKFVLVIFAIMDGAEFDTESMNLGKEILRLDDYEVVRPAAYGATQYAATGVIKLTGNLAFFFDVPEDYDPAKGVVTVNGTVMTPAGK